MLKNVKEDMPTLPLREYRNHVAFVFSDFPDKFHVTPRMSETIMAQELSYPYRLGVFSYDCGWPLHLDSPADEGTVGPDAWISCASQQGVGKSSRGRRARGDHAELSASGVEGACLESVGYSLLSSARDVDRRVLDDLPGGTTSSPRQRGRRDCGTGRSQSAEPIPSFLDLEAQEGRGDQLGGALRNRSADHYGRNSQRALTHPTGAAPKAALDLMPEAAHVNVSAPTCTRCDVPTVIRCMLDRAASIGSHPLRHQAHAALPMSGDLACVCVGFPRCHRTRHLPNGLADYVIESPKDPRKTRTATPQPATVSSSEDDGGSEELEKDMSGLEPEVANLRLGIKAMQKQLRRKVGSPSPTRSSKAIPNVSKHR